MKRIMGVIPAKKDLRDYTLKTYAANFPITYECPTCLVKDQGQVGSCAAFATAEILESHYGEKLSTDFIYGNGYNLFGTEGPGMMLRDACKIVQKLGDPNWEFCYTNTEVDKVYSIASKAANDSTTMYSAGKHKILSYVKLNGINDIKYALMNYGPILAAVNWYEDNQVFKGLLRQGTIPMGGHAIMIYGWCEEGFLMQNSWGTAWGNKGKCVLPYNYKIEEAYGFTFGDTTQIKKPCKLLKWLYKLMK